MTDNQIPWGQIISGILTAIVIVIPITWWLVSRVDKLQEAFNNLVSGATKTADGKAITIINGVQDEKLRETEKISKEAHQIATGNSIEIKKNSDEIRLLKKEFSETRVKQDEAIEDIAKQLRKYSDGNEKLQSTYLAFLEGSRELLTAAKNDRAKIDEMFNLIAKALKIKVKK